MTSWSRKLVVGAPLALAAFGGLWRGVEPAAGRPQSDASTSAQVYLHDCSFCHGTDGEGTERAPTLVGVGTASTDFMLRSGRMPIPLGTSTAHRGAPRYDADTIAALVDHVATFGGGGPSIPALDLSNADIGAGGASYRLNCAACHHAAGSGGALLQREAPNLRQATPVQVAEATRVGPGQMPAFGEAAMSDDEVRDVAAYVTAVLHDPPDRGGAPIGRLGPVPEGAVAIVCGLGSLVLFAAWIEGRARRVPARRGDDDAR